MSESNDFKEKFRPPVDAALDRQIDAAVGEVSLDELYGFDKAPPPPPEPKSSGEKGIIRGRIVQVTKDDVFVDIGGKNQGVVPIMQFPDEPQVGQERDFKIVRYDQNEGLLLLSLKGSAEQEVTRESVQVGQTVEGLVTGMNQGGIELKVAGLRAFMPASQVELFHVDDFSPYVNKKLTAEVTQVRRGGREVILSRRRILEREKEEQKKQTMAELAEGQVRRGTVRSLMEYGAFVDLGGVDGLLHVSEMSYRRGRAPGEFVNVGDQVEVKIIKVDPATGKISLSLKQALGIDPWIGVENKYAVGSQITGRVTKVESFGAFIEAEEGVEGLLPVSEISWQRIRHPSDVLKEGDTVKVVVIALDPDQRKITFSLKQAGPDPWSSVTDRFATDMVTSGRVTRVVDFGAFVELEPGLEGLVHISELADRHVKNPNDVVKQGEEVRVRIKEIDREARRISLSIRGAAEKPAAPEPVAVPAASQKKKKRPQLRGGLDF